MQHALKKEIKRLCRRAFNRGRRADERSRIFRERVTKRSGVPALAPLPKTPSNADRHFDPLYCIRNANFLSKVIWSKVLEGKYEPQPAATHELKKPGGGSRTVTAFTIPDAALAKLMFERISARNIKRLSPHSYAYHPRKNTLDAVLALSKFSAEGHLYAVQIDFEKYFDKIPKSYLERLIERRDLLSLTPHERLIMRCFLSHYHYPRQDFGSHTPKRRFEGTPQGSSLSLILANLANSDLDDDLSRKGGVFVRFADDVVALAEDYRDAQALSNCFSRHCKKTGLKINAKKSPGISIISKQEQELRTYAGYTFLGYQFTEDGLSLPTATIARTKDKISRLINIYLFRYLKLGYNSSRASAAPENFDWDLLGLISELRRSLYGGLPEQALKDLIEHGTRPQSMKGTMGFYCLLDDPSALRELDGWMLNTLRRAMVKRNKILQSKFGCKCPTPNNKDLATGTWLNKDSWRGENPPESQAPSFMRGWRAARKYYFSFGLEDVVIDTYGYDATDLLNSKY